MFLLWNSDNSYKSRFKNDKNINWVKNWKVLIWYKRKNINFRDFQVFCSSYYFSMFGSKWKKSSKNYKIPKKKETITLQWGFIRKKYQFPRFQSFWFCSILKIENCEISENFILLKFLVVYETQSRKNDLKEKALTLRCGLRRKNVHSRGFQVFDFALYLKLKTWKPRKVFVYFNFLSFWLH